MTTPSAEARSLPQIDHLTSAALRRRAADDRADALALAGRLSAASVAMLLTDAARCELRASLLEMAGGAVPLPSTQAPSWAA